MVKQYPCSVCSKCVKANQKGLLCTYCKKWVHINCSSVPVDLYNDRSEEFLDWKCSKCILKQLPFYDIKDPNSCLENQFPPKPVKSTQISNDLNFDVLYEKGLKCVQLNIVSLTKNIDELRTILIKNGVHVCALNETRLDKDIDDSDIKVPDYSVIRKDRNRNGGGVAIYIHKDINY